MTRRAAVTEQAVKLGRATVVMMSVTLYVV